MRNNSYFEGHLPPHEGSESLALALDRKPSIPKSVQALKPGHVHGAGCAARIEDGRVHRPSESPGFPSTGALRLACAIT